MVQTAIGRRGALAVSRMLDTGSTHNLPQDLTASLVHGDPAVGYVRAVEDCFLQIRGRGVLWSPLDAARALGWHGLGLSAGMTVRVLWARVEAWRFRHGRDARLPMHLGWYEPAVLEQTKHLRRLSAPGGSVDLVPEPAAYALADLVAELPPLMAAQASSAVLQHVYAKAFDWLDKPLHGVAVETDAAGMEGTGPAVTSGAVDADAVLASCRARMHKLLLSALSDAQRESLAAHLAADGVAPGVMSRKAIQARDERRTELFLAETFEHQVPTRQGWRDPRAE